MPRMPTSRYLEKWAEDYGRHLSIFKRDLELYLGENNEIFISLDFKDIFDYSFPDMQIFRKKTEEINNMDQLEQEYKRASFIRKTLTRYWLLEFDSLYSENGVVILPPYMAEAFDLFKMFRHQLNEFISRNEQDKKDFIENLSKELEGITFEGDIDIYFFLEKIENNAAYLAFLLTPSFDEDINTLKDLLKNRLLTTQQKINNFDSIILNSFLKDCDNTKAIIDIIRLNKIMQNYKDARAIQYTEDINKKMDDNSIFLLISSADVFRNYREHLIENNLDIYRKIINGRGYCPIRDLATFEVALLELCDYLGRAQEYEDTPEKISKFELGKKDYLEVLKRVDKHLDIIKKYINARKGIIDSVDDGRQIDGIVEDINSRFMELMFNREKLNLVTMMKKMCQNQDALNKLEKYIGKESQLMAALRTIEKLRGLEGATQVLNFKHNTIKAKMDELESDLNRNFMNLSRIDKNYKTLIHNFGRSIKDILEDGSLIEFINILNLNNLEYPEDPDLIECDMGLWVLNGSNNLRYIYYIEIIKGDHIYYRYDLIQIKKLLIQILNGLKNGMVDPIDLSQIELLNNLNNNVFKFKDKIKNQDIKNIELMYKQLKEQADIIAKYKELSFTKYGYDSHWR